MSTPELVPYAVYVQIAGLWLWVGVSLWSHRQRFNAVLVWSNAVFCALVALLLWRAA